MRRVCRRPYSGGFAAPELFELIEVSRFRIHDVDDHITKIHQYPFTLAEPFHAQGPMFFTFRLLDHVFRDGADMPAGAPGSPAGP